LRSLLLSVVALCAFSAGAVCQSVDSVAPDQGTLGSELTLTGSGFGDARGRVTLVDPDKKKDPPLAILSWSDTLIEVRVRRVPAAGPATLQVHPKDGDTAAATFTVLPPVLAGFDKTIATPKEKLVITVQDVGNRMPRVDVGWKKVPIVKIKKVEGAPDDREITIRVPRRKLADGTWNVTVSNGAGQDVVETVLQITGSKRRRIASRQVRGTVRGVDFKVTTPGMKTAAEGPEIVTTAKGKSKDKTIEGTLTITFEQPPLIPTEFSGPPADVARLTYSEVVDGVEITWTSDGQPVSITTQSKVKLQFGGIFEGTLVADGQPDVELKGAFVNRLP
jgi:hypothetical protein